MWPVLLCNLTLLSLAGIFYFSLVVRLALWGVVWIQTFKPMLAETGSLSSRGYGMLSFVPGLPGAPHRRESTGINVTQEQWRLR